MVSLAGPVWQAGVLPALPQAAAQVAERARVEAQAVGWVAAAVLGQVEARAAG